MTLALVWYWLRFWYLVFLVFGIVNLSFVSRYILGEADCRNMLENLPDNKALEVGLKMEPLP